jgi:hypothetical protein
MVSPGLKAGMSSRSDAWSTKSSLFIERHFLAVAACDSCTHTGRGAVIKPMGFGPLVRISQQPGGSPAR